MCRSKFWRKLGATWVSISFTALASAARADDLSARDACRDPGLVIDGDASKGARTVFWSCLEVALDVPAGVLVETLDGNLDGLTVRITEATDTPTFEVRLHATYLEDEPSVALSDAIGPRERVELDGGAVEVPAQGPIERREGWVARRYEQRVDGTRIAAFRAARVLGSGLHRMTWAAFSTTLSARALAERIRPLTRLRRLTTTEARAMPPADWASILRGRSVPLNASGQHGRVTHTIALCEDGTYRLVEPSSDAPPELPRRGTWRIWRDTLGLSGPRWRAAGGIIRITDDALTLGPLGRTTGAGPYASAAEHCAHASPRQ